MNESTSNNLDDQKPSNVNDKQTAVQWLVDQLLNNKGMVVISTSTYYFNEEVVKQALEMEKDQIMNAVDIGFEEGCKFPEDIKLNNAEQYYKETYEQ